MSEISTWERSAEVLQEKIGYSFANPALLREALTHSTYSYEHRYEDPVSNERLEFLGDSVLSLTVCEYLFDRLTEEPEGRLTKLRALLVCEETLAQVGMDIGLPSCLLLGRGEGLHDGSQKPSNLADAVEAILGAILKDGGFEAARKTVLRLLQPYIEPALTGSLIYDFKSVLLEMVQKTHHSSDLRFVVEDTSGPAHAPHFMIGVYLCGQFLDRAEGTSKKEAEQRVSKKILETYTKENVFKID